MFICQNCEGVHPYLLKCCGGTCSFVGMLKGYIIRKRLGTPGVQVQSFNLQSKLNEVTVESIHRTQEAFILRMNRA